MRILLIMPRFASPHQPYDFPLGIAYVSSALKRAGHEVRCINLNTRWRPTAEVVMEEARRFRPKLCATGGLASSLGDLREILAAAKGVDARIVTLLGGGLLTSDPETVARLIPFDVGVLGEGEEPVVEAAAALESGAPLTAVDGLVLPQADGTLIRTPPRRVVKNIDSYPWPDFEGFEADKLVDLLLPYDNYAYHYFDQPRALPIIASRSCPFGCTFCFHPNGRVYRERNLEDFLREGRYLIERYRLNMLLVLDELLAFKRERLLAFCEGMKALRVQWMCQLHVKVVDDETLIRLKEAGCIYLSLGLESMSPAVLSSMKKKADPAQLDRALELTHRHRLGIQGNFIIGDPAETPETAAQTLSWWEKNPVYQVSFTRLKVFPGSPVFEAAVARGVVTDRAAALQNPGINLTGMDDETLDALYRRIATLNMTCLEPSALRSFQRQTPDHPARGPLYEAAWACRWCGAENRTRNLSPPGEGAPGITDDWVFHLSCRTCLARSHVMNVAHAQRLDPAAEALLAQGEAAWRQARGNGDGTLVRRAAEHFSEVLHHHFDGVVERAPWAVIQAARRLGELHLRFGSLETALLALRIAVLGNPWNAEHHVMYGQALVKEGSPAAARMHLRTALALRPDGERAWRDPLERLLAALERVEGGAGGGYFSPDVAARVR
ncbi:MAG: B12-binding domain-containing radical SAM protein [Magnetococcales bacterium]|nr:B12-binding domain-containing radical SAM protein [Magnetococcales bacterium]